jgi:hypothetical protein
MLYKNILIFDIQIEYTCQHNPYSVQNIQFQQDGLANLDDSSVLKSKCLAPGLPI